MIWRRGKVGFDLELWCTDALLRPTTFERDVECQSTICTEAWDGWWWVLDIWDDGVFMVRLEPETSSMKPPQGYPWWPTELAQLVNHFDVKMDAMEVLAPPPLVKTITPPPYHALTECILGGSMTRRN
ncbi:hypothetical protein Tco_0222570 [Tanacetum coccineum]